MIMMKAVKAITKPTMLSETGTGYFRNNALMLLYISIGLFIYQGLIVRIIHSSAKEPDWYE